MITFNIHRSRGLVSRLIMFFSGGGHSHVSIQFGEFVYEAKEGEGVIRTINKLWDNSTVVESISLKSFSDKFEQETYKFLEDQVGKDYDYTGIVSFLWGFRHPVMGKWFCSEYAFVALAKWKGIPSGDYDNQKVSPSLFRDIIKLVKC